MKAEELFKEPVCTLLLSADQIEEYQRLVDAEKEAQDAEWEKQQQQNAEESNVKSIYCEEDEIFGREFC